MKHYHEIFLLPDGSLKEYRKKFSTTYQIKRKMKVVQFTNLFFFFSSICFSFRAEHCSFYFIFFAETLSQFEKGPQGFVLGQHDEIEGRYIKCLLMQSLYPCRVYKSTVHIFTSSVVELCRELSVRLILDCCIGLEYA